MRFAIIALLLCIGMQQVDAHGWMTKPISRARRPITNEPQSANKGGVCGTVGAKNFNDVQYSSLKENNAGSVKFTKGGTIEIETKVTAHHKGHYEYRICTDGSKTPTQACFDQHLLELDDSYPTPSPKDTDHPDRWYVPPNTHGSWLGGSVSDTAINGDSPDWDDSMAGGRRLLQSGLIYRMRYKLPVGVTCTHCVLQWTWITGNSCVAAGYKSYFEKYPQYKWYGWMGTNNAGTCNGKEKSTVVGGTPEKFWGCADFSIQDCPGGVCPPAPPTPPAPTPPAPTPPTPPAPTPPAPAGGNTGGGSTGGGSTGGGCSGAPCPDASMCRSKWGHCGASSAYCDGKSTWSSAGCSGGSSPSTSPAGGSTGGGSTGGGCSGAPCPDASMCRSEWGFCGRSTAHCNEKSTWKSAGCGGSSPSTPTNSGSTTPAPASGGADCAAWTCSKQKAACSDHCRTRGNLRTNQCWGTPTYMQCVCADGTNFKTPCHNCANPQCPKELVEIMDDEWTESE